MRSDVDSGPNLLLNWNETPDQPRWFRAGIGSVAVHVVLFALGFAIGSLETPQPHDLTQIASTLHKVTPLYAPPPKELTQKDPNRGKVSQEVNVEGLLEHTRKPASVPTLPLRSFKPPVPQKQPPQQPALPRLAEPPKIETAVNAPPITPPAGMPAAPPPPKRPANAVRVRIPHWRKSLRQKRRSRTRFAVWLAVAETKAALSCRTWSCPPAFLELSSARLRFPGRTTAWNC